MEFLSGNRAPNNDIYSMISKLKEGSITVE